MYRFFTRLNLLLLAMTMACAVGVILSQHKARHLFTQLKNEERLAREMNTEWGQLQLEQSTWAMHSRIEKMATELNMRIPDVERTHVVTIHYSEQNTDPAQH